MENERDAGRPGIPDEPRRIRDGGPAFPARTVHVTTGLSRRDYFAGQALTGMYASLVNASDWPDPSRMAMLAYAQADAMLAEGGA